MKSGITYQVSYITIIDSKDNKNNSQVYVHKSADKVGSLLSEIESDILDKRYTNIDFSGTIKAPVHRIEVIDKPYEYTYIDNAFIGNAKFELENGEIVKLDFYDLLNNIWKYVINT